MEKIEYLDGLRGICAVVVVLHHFGQLFFPSIASGSIADLHYPLELIFYYTPLAVLFNGNFAVCIFFVLSGYFLSYKFYVKGLSFNVYGAIAKRYVRLILPMIGPIVIAYLFMKYNFFYDLSSLEITKSDWAKDFWHFSPNLIAMLYNELFAIFFKGTHSYLVVFWTMPFEFFNSVFIYFFIKTFGRNQLRYFLYFILVILFFQTYFLAFLLGTILSDYFSKVKFNKKEQSSLSTVIFVILFFLGICLGSLSSFLVNATSTIVLLHVLGAFLVIFSLLYSLSLRKIFSYRIILFLGKISFSLYLLHILILCSFTPYVFSVLITYSNYFVSVLVSFILTWILLISISYIYSIFVDRFAVKTALALYSTFFTARKY
jgi:peptidoglycan/LPS O-acetylase OafA/YrhL